MLSGQILSEALSSFGSAHGQRMTEQELGREVNRLEMELGLMEESKDKLEQVNERLGAELSRQQERFGQLDHLQDRAEIDERRSQEKMFQLNTSYNNTMKELRESVVDLSRLYEAAREDMDSPHFLSSINLNKITEADAVVDQAVQELMSAYFSKVSPDSFTRWKVYLVTVQTRHEDAEEPPEQCHGRQQEDFDQLVGEISRLRVCLVRQELRRVKALAEEAGLIAVAHMLADRNIHARLGAGAVQQTEEEIKTLELEACEVLEQSLDLQCKKLLSIEQKNKERRNGLVITRLENIRDVLLQQLAKREILAVLLDKEMKETKMVEDLYKEMIETLKTESTNLSQFRAAMKSLGGKKSESDSNLIPAEDSVMVKVHKVLHSHKLVGHLPIYEEVFKALEKLEEKSRNLDKQLQVEQRAVTDDITASTEKMSEILSVLTLNQSNRQSCLTPRNIETGMKTVQNTMQKLNEKLNKVNKNWKKDIEQLKIKPELSLLRDMWIDFIVNPKSLVVAMKNLEIKAERGKR